MILHVNPDIPASLIAEALHTHGLEIKQTPADGTFHVVRAKCATCGDLAVISSHGKLMCPTCYTALALYRW